jgi:polyhydroxybutyrate depolymerase
MLFFSRFCRFRSTGPALLLCAGLLLAGILPAAPARADDARSLQYDSLTRHYYVHVPAAAHGKGKVPLMLVLHGGGGTARSIVYSSGMSQLSDKEGFIVVYPDGSGRSDKKLTWNAGGCCAYSMRKKVDDLGFINAVLDDVAARYPVDMRRVYVTGLSNGAMMAYRVAGALSNRIAAAGIVSGAIFGDQPRPAVPVPLIIFHGDKDTTVPFNGGESDKAIVTLNMDEEFKPVMTAYDFWRRADGCTGAVERSTGPNVTLYRATQCAQGTAVVLYELALGGHGWPGGFRASPFGDDKDNPVQNLPASRLMWDFFKNYSR